MGAVFCEKTCPVPAMQSAAAPKMMVVRCDAKQPMTQVSFLLTEFTSSVHGGATVFVQQENAPPYCGWMRAKPCRRRSLQLAKRAERPACSVAAGTEALGDYARVAGAL